MKPFKVLSVMALSIGFCAFSFPSMAQQQGDSVLSSPLGGFLQNIFGYGNNQSAGYPGSSANRPPIYSPNSDYQGNDDYENDDEYQADGSPGGRLGSGNYQDGERRQYDSSYAGGCRGYHGNDGYGDENPNDSGNVSNGRRNGGYHSHRHHHHPYGQYGSQSNWNGRAQGYYQNQNSQYDLPQQTDSNYDDSNY